MQVDEPRRASLVRLFESLECPVQIADGRVPHRQILRADVLLPGLFLEARKNLFVIDSGGRDLAEIEMERARLRRALQRLTPDQAQVVVLKFVEGLSNAEIARQLYLSPNTLKAHTQNIYSKMDVHSRVQAVNREAFDSVAPDQPAETVRALYPHLMAERRGCVRGFVCDASQKCVAPEPAEGRFFIRRDGLLWATPLFVTLIVVESTDIVFATDSIPAILGITTDPFIVYTSNIFAILGLRALYFLLSSIMEMFRFLHYGLSVILVFVGAKMLFTDFIHLHVLAELLIVAGILAVAITLSLLIPDRSRPSSPPAG